MNSHPQSPPSHPQRLALIEQARKSVLDTRDPNAPAALSPWIDRSWRRCLGMGFNPHQPIAFDAVTQSAVRNAIDANQPLLRAAAPVIQSLTRAMANTRYFAILTDANGLVIDVNGPVDRHNPQAASIARVGVDLSERAVGTSAIGATLAELQPVWLHRGEHFFDATSVYSCAGGPIWGPDGQCVGMLDLTGVNVVEQPALKHLVTQSARSIENALALARPHRLLLSLNWPGQSLGGDSDGLVCVDADGHITGLNRPAADMLGIAPLGRAGHCTDVFAVPVESLFDAARAQRSATEVPLWSGLRIHLHAQLNAGGERAPLHGSGAAVPLKDVETALIRKAVAEARGNVMEAARALGISRATVYRKLMRRKSGD
ncbi:MAG: helix-turn-helix domain-containing protein [Hydrogenophaga sp.]|uniref:helix-turn-helix domain-containing protein n=1 Tax=Hydrogenophaga sp. TaxID=1904254 RepID=UPI002AB8F8CE|nr:helix-turn-helix domain-containing protein [Hydrogenophaga sp.]MDZ4279813.1 helix-turn-helix domain-containing protein [Hydrogenophaga sp.]